MDLPRIPIADADLSLGAGIDLMIDALFGTGLATPPRDPRWIQWMNDAGFWIIGRISGLTTTETLKTATIQLAIMGVVGLLATMLGAWLLPLT